MSRRHPPHRHHVSVACAAVVTADQPLAREGGDPAVFTFHRDNPAGDLDVFFSADIGADGGQYTFDIPPRTANPSGRFIAHFADGQPAVAVTATPVDDAVVESSPHDIRVALVYSQTNAVPYAYDPTIVHGTLLDNDYQVSVERGYNYQDDSAVEGRDNPAGFRLRRSGDYAQPLTVKFDTSGSATPGEDYDDSPFAAGEVTFDVGESERWLPLDPVDDEIPEWTEDIVLTVEDDAAYRILGSHSEINEIVDDDLGLSFATEDDPEVGQLLLVNDNDDDENGQLDLDDVSVATDPDLVPLYLETPQQVKPGATISLTGDGTKVRVWDSPNKGGDEHLVLGPGKTYVEWVQGTDEVPSTLWVEAIAASGSLKDVQLALADDDSFAQAPPARPTGNQRGVEVTNQDIFISSGGQNINDKAQTVVVGQAMSLALNERPLPVDSIQWTIPGSKVSGYTLTDAKTTINDTINTAAALQRPIADYYWIRASNGPLEVTLQVKVKNRTIERKAKFTVTSPDVRITAKTLDLPPISDVAVSPLDQTTNPGAVKISWRHELDPGITFTVPNFPSTTFSGQTQWVQLLNTEWSRKRVGGAWMRQDVDTTGGMLDTSYPYSSGLGPDRGTADSPGEVVNFNSFDQTEVFYEFTMYLMYKHDTSSI